MPTRDFTPEEISIVKGAVEEFEQAYPGALPDELHFILVKEFSDGRFAEVHYRTQGHKKVYITQHWLERFHRASLITGDFVAARIASDEGGSAKSLHFGRQAIIFHELAHVADYNLGDNTPRQRRKDMETGKENPLFDPESIPANDSDAASEQDFYPYYYEGGNEGWFPGGVKAGDWRLPSDYAIQDHSEFFAEALSDAFVNKEKAAPYSLFTVDQFRRHLNGRTDEAKRWAETVKLTLSTGGLVTDVLESPEYIADAAKDFPLGLP
jgi:hypothetical protein